MCPGITGYGCQSKFTGNRRWNHVPQHQIVSTQCRLASRGHPNSRSLTLIDESRSGCRRGVILINR
jgi:hypothetical protein